MENATGTIARGNSVTILVDFQNVGCYTEILAYSLDDDAGTVPVRTGITTDEECRPNFG